MPGRTFEESEAIRKWVEAAIKAGQLNPRSVQEYIEQNADITPPPSIPTIGNIMKDLGYSPAGRDWMKKGK